MKVSVPLLFFSPYLICWPLFAFWYTFIEITFWINWALSHGGYHSSLLFEDYASAKALLDFQLSTAPQITLSSSSLIDLIFTSQPSNIFLCHMLVLVNSSLKATIYLVGTTLFEHCLRWKISGQFLWTKRDFVLFL